MISDDDFDLFNRPPTAAVHSVRTKRAPKPSVEIPFMQRPTCTIKEACKASGMGRTKFYELINGGELKMISYRPPPAGPGTIVAQIPAR